MDLVVDVIIIYALIALKYMVKLYNKILKIALVQANYSNFLKIHK